MDKKFQLHDDMILITRHTKAFEGSRCVITLHWSYCPSNVKMTNFVLFSSKVENHTDRNKYTIDEIILMTKIYLSYCLWKAKTCFSYLMSKPGNLESLLAFWKVWWRRHCYKLAADKQKTASIIDMETLSDKCLLFPTINKTRVISTIIGAMIFKKYML